MYSQHSEAEYAIDFHQDDALRLGEFLRNRQSVEIVGMPRVGISNFLRFFLHHKKIIPAYVNDKKKHLFISVDLFDLIECNLYSFWHLLLKRIYDKVELNGFSKKTSKKINHLFLTSIQTKDLFLTIDAIRKSLQLIVREEYLPTIFIVRFDRLKEAFTGNFFDNLQSLTEATGYKLAYVFTGFRTLAELAPNVFKKNELATFLQTLYLKPAQKNDLAIISKTMEQKYHLKLNSTIRKNLILACGGHVQYLHLCLIIVNELQNKNLFKENEFLEKVVADERIFLQSEEIFESLYHEEKITLQKICKNKINNNLRPESSYLFNTGILSKNLKLFNTFFDYYLKKINGLNPKKIGPHFTKKEEALYNLLLKRINKVCDRLLIQEAVWPEYEEIGVSDWAIDRLISRLRNKINLQNKAYRIHTVRTKGFTLTEKHSLNYPLTIYSSKQS